MSHYRVLVTPAGLAWQLTGGIAYMPGAACHFVAICGYVLPRA